ncbi:S-layer homology domain-containing protein [Pseudobacteroides cellulosolvens]|uniref:S-layer domain-containing protein n=1 Tax=Pseudobacteroides cellulosolvens ATCC 35603 = DSM 2933 TaxID=398512 RepID=A0A0L6JN31_9FIRM|nr:S-layer homology domain-containing protein [Pseudobacteroides cellulosolvens]KNY27184.1 S-layer domain-containing protein [Pseudobacteroides cellulosolvens ATCC 35603 = DSM 2933]
MVQKKLIRAISLLLIIITSGVFSVAADEKEVPEAIFSGIDNASAVLNNIDYIDIKNSNTWAKEAIYETGALGIMKGYGNRNFGLNQPVTKEQAIAAAYRVAGREGDAQKTAEELDNARQPADKKKNAISMWADGYLQLAADEGLISNQDRTDAFNTDPTKLIPGTSFYRANYAQRQEFGDWLAKTMKIEPVYGQDKIFNSFMDWSAADPIRIPYLEGLIKNNIMNGTGNGRFDPTGTLTRAQVAQIIKNGEKLILPILKLNKTLGTIEGIKESTDSSLGERITTNTFNIRNVNGKLHKVDAQFLTDAVDKNKNEQIGTPLPGTEKDFIVYKYGKIGKSDLLESGDRVEYIIGEDKSVRFVNVISSVNDTKYMAAQVNSIDSQNLTINVTRLMDLEYPDVSKDGKKTIANGSSGLVDSTYRYSNSVKIYNEGIPAAMETVKPDSIYILTLRDDMVTGIKSVNLTLDGDLRIVKGIVEENNPQLGYITLYGENGQGTNPSGTSALRTFSYVNPNNINVNKNSKKVGIDDIEPGDSVFMKLDEKMNVYDISGVDNYISRYARIIAQKPSAILVEYDNGSQQVLPVDGAVPVVVNNTVAGVDQLKDGDRIKLILNQTKKDIVVKGITINDSQKIIRNIYKGSLVQLNETTKDLVLQNMERLSKGQWERSQNIGISKINLGDYYKLYSGDKAIDDKMVNNILRNQEAYIAAEGDYGGGERAVQVTFRDKGSLETLADDIIARTETAAGQFELNKSSNSMNYGPSTIIVKDGKLVTGNSITIDDAAYIVANRDNDTGDYFAGVIQLNDRIDPNALTVYRGRIKALADNKNFELESFSQLKGQNWEFVNTPKTFKITYDTKILDDEGLIPQREFTGYGVDTYLGRSVYVVSDNINALLVSTAPYGPDGAFAKGSVFELSGGSTGSDGKYLTEPTGIVIKNSKVYDMTNHVWADSKDITLSLLKNTVIIKDKKEINPSQIQVNDNLRVYKKGKTETGDGYIVFVED